MIRETRTVNITDDDIKAGKPKNCMYCPGALAIKRAFPEAKYVDIMQEQMHISFPRSYKHEVLRVFTCFNPEPLVDFIQAFDAGKPVNPISFDLSVSLEES